MPRQIKVKGYVYYNVFGKGSFPLDMLRYDASEPATPEDAALISVHTRKFDERMGAEELKMFKTVHHINLRMRVHVGGYQGRGPTTGRWNSFMWGVATDPRPYYKKLPKPVTVTID